MVNAKHVGESWPENPGEFRFLTEGRTMAIRCPCGACEDTFAIHVAREGDDRTPPPGYEKYPCWRLSGPPEALTLRPSIQRKSCACMWHGWLTDGVFVTCQ